MPSAATTARLTGWAPPNVRRRDCSSGALNLPVEIGLDEIRGDEICATPIIAEERDQFDREKLRKQRHESGPWSQSRYIQEAIETYRHLFSVSESGFSRLQGCRTRPECTAKFLRSVGREVVNPLPCAEAVRDAAIFESQRDHKDDSFRLLFSDLQR
jgi:hypothetical protein